MKRAIYSAKNIPRDPKMDASYQYIIQREAQFADMAVDAEVAENANATPIALPEQPTPTPAPQGQLEAAVAAELREQAVIVDDSDEVPF